MLVVVGGHSRNIGKTSVVCGIVRGLPEFRWTAVKITQYGHGVCTHAGEPCECADPRHPVALSEERGDDPTTDSGRFLAAGAARAFWLRTPAGRLGEALPRLRSLLEPGTHAIVESNSLLQFLRPDLCLMVMDGAQPDFKLTSRRFLDRADAVVVTSGAHLSWQDVPSSLFQNKRRFEAFAPSYKSDALVACIRRRAQQIDARANRNPLAPNLQL
jgi:hypothetical protein